MRDTDLLPILLKLQTKKKKIESQIRFLFLIQSCIFISDIVTFDASRFPVWGSKAQKDLVSLLKMAVISSIGGMRMKVSPPAEIAEFPDSPHAAGALSLFNLLSIPLDFLPSYMPLVILFYR